MVPLSSKSFIVFLSKRYWGCFSGLNPLSNCDSAPIAGASYTFFDELQAGNRNAANTRYFMQLRNESEYR